MEPTTSPATLQVGRLDSRSDPLEPSPAATLVDYDACILSKSKSIDSPTTGPHADIKTKIPVLSQRRKWSLLMVFCLGFFIDIWMYSGTSPSHRIIGSIDANKIAFFVFTGPISSDLSVPFEQQTWVITSYAVRVPFEQQTWVINLTI
jgi:hypothetical protein